MSKKIFFMLVALLVFSPQTSLYAVDIPPALKGDVAVITKLAQDASAMALNAIRTGQIIKRKTMASVAALKQAELAGEEALASTEQAVISAKVAVQTKDVGLAKEAALAAKDAAMSTAEAAKALKKATEEGIALAKEGLEAKDDTIAAIKKAKEVVDALQNLASTVQTEAPKQATEIMDTVQKMIDKIMGGAKLEAPE